MDIKNSVKELMSALSADAENADLVEDVKDVLQRCAEYIDMVNQEEQSIQMARFTMEGANYRAFVQNIDRSRRILHNALMGNINMLNRICAMEDLPPIAADVSEGDRETYAAFAKRVVDEYFTTKGAGSATN